MPRTLPAAGSTDPAGQFVIQKHMTVNGAALSPGQLLPPDSLLRSMPHKLNALCRTRHIRQLAAPVSVPAVSTPSVKMKLMGLPAKQLIKLCKDRGIDYVGLSRFQLRKAIRASLA